MAEAAPAIAKVIELEGGFVDHPDDPGGRTKWGISQRTYPELDIAALTKEQAAEIYERDFWLPIWSEIKSQEVAQQLFVMAVNTGIVPAVKAHQVACNVRGSRLKVDGRFGPKTLAATNALEPAALLLEQRKRQVKTYFRIARRQHPHPLPTFLLGWVLRVLDAASA